MNDGDDDFDGGGDDGGSDGNCGARNGSEGQWRTVNGSIGDGGIGEGVKEGEGDEGNLNGGDNGRGSNDGNGGSVDGTGNDEGGSECREDESGRGVMDGMVLALPEKEATGELRLAQQQYRKYALWVD